MQNKEVKIAIIMGAIMITICLVLVISVKSKNKIQNVELNIYKLHEEIDENDDTKYYYTPCSLPDTDSQISIMRETAKALKLGEDSLITGEQIKGNYKIEYNGKMIAFDGNENEDYVYKEETKRLYTFKTELYETIKKVCN